MARFIGVLLVGLLLPFITQAQLSTTDIRHAASCGPYPVYLGLGWGHTWEYSELETIITQFAPVEEKKRLNGLNGFLGVSLIPEGSSVSWLVEASFHHLDRKLRNSQGVMTLEARQLGLSGGMRWVFAPLFVVQGQLGTVVYHRKNYHFNDGTAIQSVVIKQDDAWFNELTTKIRIALLDPAGTEGGIGFYVEVAQNWLHKTGSASELEKSIQLFNPQFEGAPPAKRNYRQFSVGIIIPVGLRF